VKTCQGGKGRGNGGEKDERERYENMNGVEWNGEEEVEEEKFWLQQSREIDDAWGERGTT